MTDDTHVYPVNDKCEHVLQGTECTCEPEVRLEGSVLIIIHNFFDFREVAEELNEPRTR